MTPDCYVDEEKNFARVADADYVQVISSPFAAIAAAASPVATSVVPN